MRTLLSAIKSHLHTGGYSEYTPQTCRNRWRLLYCKLMFLVLFVAKAQGTESREKEKFQLCEMGILRPLSASALPSWWALGGVAYWCALRILYAGL